MLTTEIKVPLKFIEMDGEKSTDGVNVSSQSRRYLELKFFQLLFWDTFENIYKS